MDFGLQWHQEELRRTARDLLSDAFPLERLREAEDAPLGYVPAVCRQMAELGWLQLGFRAAEGGSDDLVDLVVLYEELGRAAAPGPHFVSAFLAARLLGALGTTRFLRSLLFGIEPVDWVTFGAVTAGLTLAAVVASYLPARRATRSDPIVVLRMDLARASSGV